MFRNSWSIWLIAGLFLGYLHMNLELLLHSFLVTESSPLFRGHFQLSVLVAANDTHRSLLKSCLDLKTSSAAAPWQSQNILWGCLIHHLTVRGIQYFPEFVSSKMNLCVKSQWEKFCCNSQHWQDSTLLLLLVYLVVNRMGIWLNVLI